MCCAAVTTAVSRCLHAHIATSPLTGRAAMGRAECVPESSGGHCAHGCFMAAEKENLTHTMTD